MNIEQVVELVEKWLEDSSSVTVEELRTAYGAADAGGTTNIELISTEI